MARGIADIVVNDSIDDDALTLVTDCYNGYAEDLHLIADQLPVTLKKDTAEKRVRVLREQGDECAFQYIEVSPLTAKELELRDGARYLIEFDEMKLTFTLTRVFVSKAQVPITVDHSTAGKKRVSIGYSLLNQLGMASTKSVTMVMKDGQESSKLRLHTPLNELDASFRIPAEIAARFGIEEGMLCTLEYNQSTKTLQCLENGLSLSYLLPKSRTRKRTRPAGSDWEDASISPQSTVGRKQPRKSKLKRVLLGPIVTPGR